MTWKRTIRTGSSERFLATREGRDVEAVDPHYLPDGAVAGTVTLFKEAGWSEQEIPELLRSIGEALLPDVDLKSGNLTFTVVMGEVLGNWEAARDDSSIAG